MNIDRIKQLYDGAAWPTTTREYHVFMKGRVLAWMREGQQIPLNEYLGMTESELAQWITTEIVPDRVRRAWKP